MNSRTMIFSGIMTALVGAMIGLAVAYIGTRQPRPRVVAGATLGFIIGASQEGIRQQSRIRKAEELAAGLEHKED